MVLRLMISATISFGLLYLLFEISSSVTDQQRRPGLLSALTKSNLELLTTGLGLYLVGSILRTLRYQRLIHSAGDTAPEYGFLFLVTLVRNMAVDLLPARLGELIYPALLNKVFRVPINTCISSLSISVLFDLIALCFLMTLIVIYQTVVSGPERQGVVLLVVCLILATLGYFLAFRALPGLALLLKRRRIKSPIAQSVSRFIVRLATAMQHTRRSGCLLSVFWLSAGVRICKYGGLIALFFAVIQISFPAFNNISLYKLMSTLLTAEATASLPIPTLMGFGLYEAGGTATMTALGFEPQKSLIILLTMHLWTQAIDYFIGGSTLVLLALLIKRGLHRKTSNSAWLWFSLAIIILIGSGATYTALSYANNRASVTNAAPKQTSNNAANTMLDSLNGFAVWSSNRSGNHELYRIALPGREIRQLTKHPNAEFYPRISPDGKRLVFARAQRPKVSQRDLYLWDIYLLELSTGNEQLIARGGTTPSWSEDGNYIYFLRNGKQFIEHRLLDNRQTILFRSGINGIPGTANLYKPSFHQQTGRLVFTTRQTFLGISTGHWGTALKSNDEATLKSIYNGCQINWAPDGSYLIQVGKGGKQDNAFYKIDYPELNVSKWLDLPGDFSHEYFPKLSNTQDFLIFGASRGGHEHDTADYEIFLWRLGSAATTAVRLTHHADNDNWPDIYLY